MDLVFSSLNNENTNEIKHLDLSIIPYDDSILDYNKLINYPQLESLKLVGRTIDLKYLECLQNLKSLNISFANIQNLKSLSKCQKLEELQMVEVDCNYNDLCLNKIKYLKISNDTINLVNPLPTLQSLHCGVIYHPSKIDQLFPNLKILKFEHIHPQEKVVLPNEYTLNFLKDLTYHYCKSTRTIIRKKGCYGNYQKYDDFEDPFVMSPINNYAKEFYEGYLHIHRTDKTKRSNGCLYVTSLMLEIDGIKTPIYEVDLANKDFESGFNEIMSDKDYSLKRKFKFPWAYEPYNGGESDNENDEDDEDNEGKFCQIITNSDEHVYETSGLMSKVEEVEKHEDNNDEDHYVFDCHDDGFDCDDNDSNYHLIKKIVECDFSLDENLIDQIINAEYNHKCPEEEWTICHLIRNIKNDIQTTGQISNLRKDRMIDLTNQYFGRKVDQNKLDKTIRENIDKLIPEDIVDNIWFNDQIVPVSFQMKLKIVEFIKKEKMYDYDARNELLEIFDPNLKTTANPGMVFDGKATNLDSATQSIIEGKIILGDMGSDPYPDLLNRMIKGVDFDPNKVYRAMVYMKGSKVYLSSEDSHSYLAPFKTRTIDDGTVGWGCTFYPLHVFLSVNPEIMITKDLIIESPNIEGITHGHYLCD